MNEIHPLLQKLKPLRLNQPLNIVPKLKSSQSHAKFATYPLNRDLQVSLCKRPIYVLQAAADSKAIRVKRSIKPRLTLSAKQPAADEGTRSNHGKL